MGVRYDADTIVSPAVIVAAQRAACSLHRRSCCFLIPSSRGIGIYESSNDSTVAAADTNRIKLASAPAISIAPLPFQLQVASSPTLPCLTPCLQFYSSSRQSSANENETVNLVADMTLPPLVLLPSSSPPIQNAATSSASNSRGCSPSSSFWGEEPWV